jgi:hypothetical protein
MRTHCSYAAFVCRVRMFPSTVRAAIDLLIMAIAHTLRVRPFKPARGRVLTNDELKASYVVIRHNVRTYESAGVVEVVKGRTNAESTLKKFESEQSSGDRHEGWRYFLEKTSLKAGTDPAEATELRQAELESRESKATQEGGGSNSGGGLSR